MQMSENFAAIFYCTCGDPDALASVVTLSFLPSCLTVLFG